MLATDMGQCGTTEKEETMHIELSDEFVSSNIMGPNTALIAEELIGDMAFAERSRILDLGCGKGVSSLVLHGLTPATVFAADLWITATENYERFHTAGADDRIVPIHADALDMPFAHGYCDALISIDSYHYFGLEQGVIDSVAAYVKPGGEIRIAVPGLIREFDGTIPEEMLLSWTPEDLSTMHSCSWWENLLGPSDSIDIVSIEEMACFDQAWTDWLACDNEYARADRAAMEAGAGAFMNLVAIKALKR